MKPKNGTVAKTGDSGMPQNSTTKKAIVTASVVCVLSFVGFTIHKIYVKDPEAYAQKKEVAEFVIESRQGRANTKALAIENREALTEMRTNFKWIKEAQEELKLQNANSLATQMKILDALKDLKK